jgi:hypothetical protein
MNYSSLEQLRDALNHMDQMVLDAVERAQAAGFDPNNTLRGLVITDEEVVELAARAPLNGLWGDSDGTPTPPHTLRDTAYPLGRIIASFGLNELDISILLLCLAPELDQRYERLYAFLQDDVTQRRPTVNLLMNIIGGDAAGRFSVWERLHASNPLRQYHLVECSPEPARPNATFITHHVKMDRRIVGYLLGDRALDERIADAANLFLPKAATDGMGQYHHLTVSDPIQNGPLILLYGRDELSKLSFARALCGQHGLSLLRVDLARFAHSPTPDEILWRLATREMLLNNSLIAVMGWQGEQNEHQEIQHKIWRDLQKLRRASFLSSQELWEPTDTDRARAMIRLSFDLPDFFARRSLWREGLQNAGVDSAPLEVDEIADKFRFSSEQIRRAIHTAVDWATTDQRRVTTADLYRGAQAHASLKLDQLAKRITPRYTWGDLILPPDQIAQIEELIARAKHAATVHHDWGFGERGVPIRRVSALFAGESGTGKTLAAEVIAGELGLVMYKIDLSAVVSKYIGETEKNLKTIFDEAQSGNAILFFDEADALLGKRSEVKDAHDRYANIEVAYLLQQIEAYDGVAIMATNLRQNVDEAFTRRLDFVVDFPFPDEEYRYHIWKVHFPQRAPLARDVNLHDVAARYRLAGGNIRNAALASAYLAAADGHEITMAHIRRAVRREHQKMGRLLDAVND